MNIGFLVIQAVAAIAGWSLGGYIVKLRRRLKAAEELAEMLPRKLLRAELELIDAKATIEKLISTRSETIDIRDFGAVPNDPTKGRENSLAFACAHAQFALRDRINEAAERGVYVPPGDWSVEPLWTDGASTIPGARPHA